MAFIKHNFCCLSCPNHFTFSRGSVWFLTSDDLFISHWRNVCEAFSKDSFQVALPLYCDLFFLFVFVMLLDSSFFLCCISVFFCKWSIQSLPMTSPFPIGGMSAKHLQKIVFKLPCHSTVISKLLHLIAAVSPTHHPRLLCCILIPTAAAKNPTTFILFFL